MTTAARKKAKPIIRSTDRGGAVLLPLGLGLMVFGLMMLMGTSLQTSSNALDVMKWMAIGLGGGLLLLVIVAMLFGLDPRKLNQLVNQAQVGGNGNVAAQQGELSPEELKQREFLATVLRFTEVVWGDQFRKSGQQYEPPKMVLFSNRVQTGCGIAPSAVGPFYCPADRTVYLDPTFFEELNQKLGGSKSEFSQAYVIAHEIGHHCELLSGISENVSRAQRKNPNDANELSVRLELQADCLAGVWAYSTYERQLLESGDLEEGLAAAAAVGDDRLQRQAGQRVNPETWTHGSSQDRVKWFKTGFESGRASSCDTCRLYTSDAADDPPPVRRGCRRTIKKNT